MITLQELCFSKHKYILLRAVQTGNGEYLRKALVFFPLDCNAITFPLVSESMMIPVMFLKEEVLSRPYFKAEVDRVLKESLDRQVSLVEIAIAQQQIEILKVIVSLHRKDSFSCLVNPWNIMQALKSGSLETLEILVPCHDKSSKKIFQSLSDPLGNTPLHYGAGLGDADLVESLIHHYGFPKAKLYFNKWRQSRFCQS